MHADIIEQKMKAWPTLQPLQSVVIPSFSLFSTNTHRLYEINDSVLFFHIINGTVDIQNDITLNRIINIRDEGYDELLLLKDGISTDITIEIKKE